VTDMEFKDFLPLASTVIGGFLAVAGGFVANFVLRGITERNEKRSFLLQQLEQIFLLSNQLVDWVGAEYGALLQSIQKEEGKSDNKIQNPIAKLQMAVRLYHPKLNEHLVHIEKCLEDFYNGRGAFYLHVLEKKEDPPLSEVFKQGIDDPFKRLREARDSLLKEVNNMVKHYL
jgi:hypothetical protein